MARTIRLANGIRAVDAGVAGFGGVNVSLAIGGFGAPAVLPALLVGTASREANALGSAGIVVSDAADIVGLGFHTVAHEVTGLGNAASSRSTVNGSGAMAPGLQQITGAGVVISGPVTVDCTAITIPSSTVNLETIRAAGFLVVTDSTYAGGADPTGNRDSTAAIQAAIDKAFTGWRSVYIPAGTYRITTTLRMYHWDNWSLNTNKKVGDSRVHFVQGCTTSPPILKLDPNLAEFGNVSDPRPVICERSFGAAKAAAAYERDLLPPHPFELPSTNWADASGTGFNSRLHSVTINTNGNKGAIGLAWTTAQDANTAHIKIIATGSFAGMCGTGGTMGASNLEITGGQYGLYYPKIRTADFASGTYVIGFKLLDQTVASICVGDFSPQVFLGGYIRKSSQATTATILDYSGAGSGSSRATVSLIDTIVETTGSGPAFPIGDKTVYLRNVYVNGTDNLIRPTPTATTYTAAGTWKRINEYSRGGGGTRGNADGSQFTFATGSLDMAHRAVLNGSVMPSLQHEIKDITPSVTAPTNVTMYVTKHSHPLLPCIDNGAYCDVTAYGAVPFRPSTYVDQSKIIYQSQLGNEQYGNYLNLAGYTGGRPLDSRAAIQAAIDDAERLLHNRVLIPYGMYYVGGPLYLRKNTQLFGVGSCKSWICTQYTWNPTSRAYVVISANDLTGTSSMNDLTIFVRREIGTKEVAPNVLDEEYNPPRTCYWWTGDWFCEVKWETGRRSWTHGVHTAHQYVNSSWPTRDRHAWTFSRNGGGRHYFNHRNGRGYWGIGARVALVDGTVEPLSFYGWNYEIGKGVQKGKGYDPQANIEIRNASNVRLYCSKREGNAATLWVNGGAGPCRNVALYGAGVQKTLPFADGAPYGPAISGSLPDAAWLAITGDADGVLIAISTVQDAENPGQVNRLMLKENLNNKPPVRIWYPEGISIYKRGLIDDSVMNFT